MHKWTTVPVSFTLLPHIYYPNKFCALRLQEHLVLLVYTEIHRSNSNSGRNPSNKTCTVPNVQAKFSQAAHLKNGT
jgi:hypothetical protein